MRGSWEDVLGILGNLIMALALFAILFLVTSECGCTSSKKFVADFKAGTEPPQNAPQYSGAQNK